MPSEQRLRSELNFVEEFRTMLDVMQQVAVSHLRRLDAQLLDAPRLIERMQREYLPLLPPSAAREPLVVGGSGGTLIIAFMSEEGMVGPLHAEVIRQALAHADQTSAWIVMGQRGRRLLGDRGHEVGLLSIPSDETLEETMHQLSHTVLARFLREGRREAWLVAPKFISMTRQIADAVRLLPLPVLDASPQEPREELLSEPSAHRVVETLAQWWIEQACCEAFWSARRAECAARALHVESCRQELAKRAKTVHHEFFKSVHERVDRQVRETCVRVAT